MVVAVVAAKSPARQVMVAGGNRAGGDNGPAGSPGCPLTVPLASLRNPLGAPAISKMIPGCSRNRATADSLGSGHAPNRGQVKECGTCTGRRQIRPPALFQGLQSVFGIDVGAPGECAREGLGSEHLHPPDLAVRLLLPGKADVACVGVEHPLPG